jgi:hypothetical protein
MSRPFRSCQNVRWRAANRSILWFGRQQHVEWKRSEAIGAIVGTIRFKRRKAAWRQKRSDPYQKGAQASNSTCLSIVSFWVQCTGSCSLYKRQSENSCGRPPPRPLAGRLPARPESVLIGPRDSVAAGWAILLLRHNRGGGMQRPHRSGSGSPKKRWLGRVDAAAQRRQIKSFDSFVAQEEVDRRGVRFRRGAGTWICGWGG